MLNKSYIADNISKEFPDLKNTEFNLNNSDLSAFSEKPLLPFLIYQNTVDSKNRIIELYLRENSSSIHLLPFYVAVGFYRKAVNRAFTARKFANEKFAPNQKTVVYNGGICHITGINFISRTVYLRGGTGDHEVPFDEDYKLRWGPYKNSADIKQRLDAFNKVDNASRNNIFTLPLQDTVRDYEGVLLFSNISKFEALLRNLRISGNDLRQHIHIQGAVFTEEEIRFKVISAPKTKDLPVTILAARNDSIMAFDNIIKAGNGLINHLNTVIIDDFDEQLLRWEKEGVLEERMAELKTIFFDRLGTDLKDIYLICKNRNFNVRQILTRYSIASLPWQVPPAEKAVLDNLNITASAHIVRMSDRFLENGTETIDKLIFQWKELGRSNFCNGQTIRQLSSLYNIREKLQSFFRPDSFRALLGRIEGELIAFHQLWFSNDQDNGLVAATREFLTELQQKPVYQPALNDDIRKAIEGADLQKGILMVTNNTNTEDQLFFGSVLEAELPGTNYQFCTVKEFLQAGTQEGKPPGLLIFFSWNRDLLNHTLTNLSAEKQVFIVSKKSRNLILNYLHRASAELDRVSDTLFKYDLLNLDPCDLEKSPGLKIIDESSGRETDEELQPEHEPEELSVYVQQVISFFSGIDNKSEKKNVKTCFIYFEDGTQLEWAENKSVFYFDEHAEEATESVQKEARLLTGGDLVLLPKNRAEMKTILRNALIQDKNLSVDIKNDDEWRKLITDFISNSGLDLETFRDALNDAGFAVVGTGTIRNWLDGETIQPHKFRKLLLALIGMNILPEEKRDHYYASNKKVKRQKVMFVRSAVKKLIFSLRGIHYGADGIFDQKLINTFLDHIDIKPVLGIYCK